MKALVPYDFFSKMFFVMCAYLAYCNFIRIYINTKKSTVWTKEIYMDSEREMHGLFSQLFFKIKNRDKNQFRRATRMGVSQFEHLLTLLKTKLEKTSPRKPIEAECRLAVTLIYLSQGSSWQMLAWAFRIGVSTIREIILETCEVIWDEFYPIYLAQPSQVEWKKIAIDFYNMSGMANCVGPIDGKHIRIKCPPNG